MSGGRALLGILLTAILLISLGCSNAGQLIIAPASGAAESATSHALWGLWQFTAEPPKGTLDVTRLRSGDMHLNAIVFLEPPPFVYLSLESLEFNGNIVEADIGLRHPFLGLNEFTGFDVCGILISNGSVTGFDDPDILLAGSGDTRLLNPDGHTRWWNPLEFPSDGTMFGYTDGLLGALDSTANFNCTLNGYKYFCDDLADPHAPVGDVTLANRGMFSAGQKNVRHYTIQLGDDGLVFNYAVDANWKYPEGDSPWQVPDDFPPDANRVEAWNISVIETENTLWNDGVDLGGELELSIDVYDWFGAELNSVNVESPGNFDAIGPIGPSGGGAGYSTYEIEITDAMPQNSGLIDLLVTVESQATGYQGLLPGEPVCAYWVYEAPVSDEETGCQWKNIDVTNTGHYASDIAIDPNDGDVLVYYRDGDVRRYFYDDCYESYETYTCFWASETNLGQQNPAKSYREMGDFIDVGDNGYFILGVHRRYDIPSMPDYNDNNVWTYFYTDSGVEITNHTMQRVAWGGWQTHIFDAHAFMSTAGVRAGDLGITWEYGSGGVRENNHCTWQDTAFSGYTNCLEGGTGITGYPIIPFIGYNHMGTETLNGNSYIWLVSREHTVAWLWELVPGTSNHNAFTEVGPRFGTESPQLSPFQNATESDSGLNYAMDITRDNDDTMYVLERLGSVEPYSFVIKGFTFTISPPGTTALGHFGDGDDWDLTPKRIEGSDFNGNIVVLHTNDSTAEAMISVFLENEIEF